MQRAGMKEICSRGLIKQRSSLHQPITIEDYLKEKESEKLKKQWLESQTQ